MFAFFFHEQILYVSCDSINHARRCKTEGECGGTTLKRSVSFLLQFCRKSGDTGKRLGNMKKFCDSRTKIRKFEIFTGGILYERLHQSSGRN